MKKTVYGNIEDLVVHVTLVTPQGVIRRNAAVSRVSAGPDLHQMIMGSEGTLGVITEVVIKIRPFPEVERYGSIAFPDFFSGVRCLRQVAKERLRVSSIRLMDNTQFRLGKGLSPAAGWLKSVKDYLAKRYVTAWKGFDMTQMTVATLLVEGYTEKEVELLSSRVFSIAASFGGFSAGEENGRRGYTMTFSIAYIRDFCLDYGVFAESFETSVPWDRVLHLCHNVKKRVEADCGKRPFILEHVTSCRVTQCYDDCACVYFYMGITIDKQFQGDPCAVYEELEHSARNEILASGGTISHHHGVGKIRQHWLPETITPTGVAALKAVKKELDPHNIFAAGNLYTMDSPPEDDSSQTKAKL
ncbi:unnamed protein product [Cyprideis torosa]|uniref:Alkylglycerone-phosphate synthase n=1 Tax=Cyprideis torosa TaxID=163714 RepID=A0A7R8WD24_9CRUS|nr:unnamed protein product [Cyprideis torosa]CAG0887935.1 unnamed protein product [Cyprideis torosa]